MQYVMAPYAVSVPPFAWWEGAFTDQELDTLQRKAAEATTPAEIGNRNKEQVHKGVRRSQISWMSNNSDTTWVFERLAEVAASLNSQFFRFDLTGFGEVLQLTNYDHSEHGMYGWHQDYNTGSISRKLSLVLQLTDPSEYEGGNLQIMTTGVPETVRKQRGLVVAFPSYVLHQVTPVTQGSRQSLVAWVSGPAFK